MATNVTAPIPSFSSPPSRSQLDPPAEEMVTVQVTETPGGTNYSRSHEAAGYGIDFDVVHVGPPTRKPDREARTPTSSAGEKPTIADTAALIGGLLLVAAAGAAVAIRWTMRAKLRRPTKHEVDEISTPLAKIAARHVDLSWLNKDLLDATRALVATGDYLSNGPLLEPLYDDPGLPTDIQGDQP